MSNQTLIKESKEYAQDDRNKAMLKDALGAQCYRLFGNHFARKSLMRKGHNLVVEQDFVEGEMLRFSSQPNPILPRDQDSVLSPEHQSQLARLAVSSILLKDTDFCGFNHSFENEQEIYALGHNLKLDRNRIVGFDAGEVFCDEPEWLLPSGVLYQEFYLNNLKHFQVKPPALAFLSWVNAVIFFQDSSNQDLAENSDLKALRQFYAVNQITQVKPEDLYKLSHDLTESGTSENRLWQCLKSLRQKYWRGEDLPVVLSDFLRSFSHEEDLRDYITFAGNDVFYPLQDDKQSLLLHSKMLGGISNEIWAKSIQEVLDSAPQVEAYLQEVDVPDEILSYQTRQQYLQIIEEQKKALRKIQTELQQGVEGKYEEKFQAIQPETTSSPEAERLYYGLDVGAEAKSDFEERGRISVVNGLLKPISPLRRELEGVSLYHYEQAKGWGRRTVKKAQSKEIEQLKARLSEEQTWQDVERVIVEIFVQEIEKGQDPFNWKKLSHRILWLFLMEAQYRQEKLGQAHANVNFLPESLEAKIWNSVFHPAGQAMMGREVPGASSMVWEGKTYDSGKVLQTAEVFARLRPHSAGFDVLLRFLGRQTDAFQSNVKWWHLGRKLLGIKGIKAIRKHLSNGEETPAEMLKNIAEILQDRMKHKGPQDTRMLYQDLSMQIARHLDGSDSKRDAESTGTSNS